MEGGLTAGFGAKFAAGAGAGPGGLGSGFAIVFCVAAGGGGTGGGFAGGGGVGGRGGGLSPSWRGHSAKRLSAKRRCRNSRRGSRDVGRDRQRLRAGRSGDRSRRLS